MYDASSWVPLAQFASATADLAGLTWSPDGACLAVWDSPLYGHQAWLAGRLCQGAVPIMRGSSDCCCQRALLDELPEAPSTPPSPGGCVHP